MGARGKNFYHDLACRYGYEQEANLIQDAYLAGRKDEAAALVPAELVEKTALIGPHGYVAERLAAFREAGVTTLNVTALAPTHEARVSRHRAGPRARRITGTVRASRTRVRVAARWISSRREYEIGGRSAGTAGRGESMNAATAWGYRHPHLRTGVRFAAAL